VPQLPPFSEDEEEDLPLLPSAPDLPVGGRLFLRLSTPKCTPRPLTDSHRCEGLRPIQHVNSLSGRLCRLLSPEV